MFATSLPSPGLFNPRLPMASGIFAEGKIIVLRNNVSCQDRLAAFGPQLPDPGLLGFLVSVSKLDAHGKNTGCTPVSAPGLSNWIALVQRGQCGFVDKVRAMQASGAKSVVVGDHTPHSGLITMFATGNTSDITVPSVFVSLLDYEELQREANTQYGYGPGVEVLLIPNDLDVPLLEIIIVTVVSPAAVMICMYIMWSYRQYLRRQQELAPMRLVLNLPTRVYSMEGGKENDPIRCAICLEDFQEGEQIRILMCKHEFHVDCVDK
ncbi:hypothetical protein SpCBS45565_g00441 [Spizellomyces sp. 'palustris']|nr:hypothetical protein SpCBS45565_g00441 [Spizellomyces sp. 'palustris']